jgi:hypothetical protein
MPHEVNRLTHLMAALVAPNKSARRPPTPKSTTLSACSRISPRSAFSRTKAKAVLSPSWKGQPRRACSRNWLRKPALAVSRA